MSAKRLQSFGIRHLTVVPRNAHPTDEEEEHGEDPSTSARD